MQWRICRRSAPEAILLGVIGRVSRQKGIDLLLENHPTIISEGMQLAVLGSGDRGLQYRYREAAQANPEQVSISTGHDEGLAHLIQAGVDALVGPTRSEPCGLTQLAALRDRTVPIRPRDSGL